MVESAKASLDNSVLAKKVVELSQEVTRLTNELSNALAILRRDYVTIETF